MKKILVLAFASASLIACNDNQTSSINDDTTDTATVMNESPATTTTTTYVPADGDVTYRDHKVMVMKNGAWVEADDDVKLGNDVVVYKNGKVKKDGNMVELRDGETVNKDGDFFDKAGQKMERVWDDTKEGAKKAGDEIEKGAKKAGDKAEDAVDHDHDNK